MHVPASPGQLSQQPPRRSVRLRLTALYCTLFIFTGAAMLAISLWWSSSVTVSPTNPAPPAPAGQQSQLAQDQARIQQLEYQVSALSDHLHAAESHQQLAGSAVALAIMAVVSAGLGWLAAGRILRPLRAMTAAARQISEDDLHRRLALPGPGDELKDLADTIDGLLARLQGAFDAERQFVANASHELRSPLAEERILLEVALADPAATAAALRTACEDALAANQEQEQLIEALLTLARSQRGLDHREPFDLADITTRLLDARRRQSQANGLDISATLAPAPAAGDPQLAERLTANLIDNALRYNIPRGQVELTTGTRNGHATLRVANTGPAVPAGQIQRLLQPFQRLSPDRTGAPAGSGLGLSIVAAIAKAHGATISARPGNKGGLDIEITFTSLGHLWCGEGLSS